MKRLIRQITASNEVQSIKHSFTPSDIVELLQNIEELNGLEIFCEENSDGSVEFTVGNNVYTDIAS